MILFKKKKIWDIYKKIGVLSSNDFEILYKAKNKMNNEYVVIKEIKKIKIEKKILEEIEIMKKIKSENLVKLIEIKEEKDSFYIISELCYLNIEEYLKKRKDGLLIEEIKEFLLDLNQGLKEMNNNKIIHGDIKPSNILISLNNNNINKICFKISDFGLSKFNEKKISKNIRTFQFMSPECLKGDKKSYKSDIWSLGILIYYLLFKQYPYNGTEHEIIKQIESKKQLNMIEDNLLDDLLKQMLNPNIDERINWEDYFNHPFFKTNNDLPYFNMVCNKHSKNYYSYCSNCKCNICELCDHNSHNVIPFYQISFTQNEMNQKNNLSQLIENRLNRFIQIKNNIEELMNKITSIEGNSLIYEDDKNNNYKKYLIDCLKGLNHKLEINENLIEINLTPLKKKNNIYENNIICEYDIKKSKDDKDDYLSQMIINSYEEANRNESFLNGSNNEKEIKENCELYLNNKRIDFYYKYDFSKDGKYIIQINIKNPLTDTNYLFYECNKLTSLNLTNFKTNEVKDMRYMFSGCSSLTSLDLSNFNTKNVENMSDMFNNCKCLTSLNLSNFNTHNVKDMYGMFSNCQFLTFLNLSEFNTHNVNNMRYMFFNCSSLTSLNLSNFNTNKTIDMSHMFNGCFSLKSLDLSNFNTNNVNDMSGMFSYCFSLTSLNLYNFNTKNVENMSNMLFNCSSLTSLNLSNFNTNNVKDMSYMFSDCSSLTSLNLSNFNTKNVEKMSNMFSGCSSLTSLDLSNFFTNNVKDMSYMFYDCSSLTSLNLSKFNTKNVEKMEYIFKNLNKNHNIICKDKNILAEIKKYHHF